MLFFRFFLMFLFIAYPVYADTAIYSSQISPHLLRITNPYESQKANTYKGQLHDHTTNSDGIQSPTAVVTAYKNVGYDFIAITDHVHLTPDPGVSGITFIQGAEATVITESDIGCINITGFNRTSDPLLQLQDIQINGGIAIMNHPHSPVCEGCGWSLANLILYQDLYFAIDLANVTLDEPLYDQLLTAGYRKGNVQTDDCHDVTGAQFNVRWVMVNADANTVSDIVQGLTSYNFYASRGPTITITRDVNNLVATTNELCTIQFIGTGGTILQQTTNVHTASYAMKIPDVYVRVKVIKSSDATIVAFSNPIWMEE